MNDFHQHLIGPPNETWQQALERFKQLSHMDIVQHWDDGKGNKGTEHVNLSRFYDDGTLFEIASKEPIENIQTYETAYGVTVPPELVALMCDYGAFAIYMVSLRFEKRWGERQFLAIYDSKDTARFPNIKPLCNALNFNGYYSFVDDELTKEQVEHLNNNYFCFGCIGLDDGDFQYLYFDRNHHFGSFKFISEDYVANMERLTPLLSGNAQAQTLDRLMSLSIDKTISLVLDCSEIYIDND
jgi:hypothetical protein